jgi:hypothetical protein
MLRVHGVHSCNVSQGDGMWGGEMSLQSTQWGNERISSCEFSHCGWRGDYTFDFKRFGRTILCVAD